MNRSCTSLYICALMMVAIAPVGCGSKTSPPPETAQQQRPPEDPAQDPSESDAGAATEPPVQNNRDSQIATALSLAERGQYDDAAMMLKQLLLVDPADVEVLFHLGNLQAARGDLASAIETLSGIPEDHPEAGIPSLGQSADWCLRLKRYDEAESRYLKILEQAPDAAPAHRKLAELLNRKGRRHEAAEHIRELCKLGNVRQDELHALIVLSDAMVSEPGEVAPGEVDYSPIGASGEARKLFTERRYDEAAAVLRETIAAGNAHPAIVALYGRAVAEAQDDEGFLWWIGKTDESVRKFSEYWAAVALYLASRQQYEAATRALLEAIDRDPTDFLSINRLPQMLTLINKPEEIERWEKRWQANHKVLLANNSISDSETPDVEAMDEISSQLFALDRKLEAVMWKSLELHYRGAPREAMNHWNLERQKLVAASAGFPDRAVRLCNSDLQAYPLPDLNAIARSEPEIDRPKQWIEESPHPASFENVAERIGLKHAFRVAPSDLPFGFAMYHQAGGGVAVLDYDLDGRADLYFAQGAAEPPDFIANDSNVLYRSVGGQLMDVTRSAAAEDLRYTIGCTAGDWNQDGFPDLMTGNIGANQLFLNNGDGTFTARSLEGSDDLQRMPASLAIADLDGDALPDVFEVNYIQDSEIARLPKRDQAGNVIEAVGPADFSPAVDRIGINDGSGNAVFKPISQDSSAAHKGLGVAIADFDGKPGNDVFVGNDKSANQLWIRDATTSDWSDIAVINGSAYSYGGAGTASMGIATADFDNSGTLDLHIANFQNEAVCLYLNQDAFFRDRAVQFKLDLPSRNVLGFGSQALDYDNNGLVDLVVTNGHIDKYSTMSGPFEQLSQLFCNLGDRFTEVQVDDSSKYWQSGHLGRALARLDFNLDGKNDFVVTHLGETSALMINQTQSSHHWLQLRLVGVQSERDAVGARITIRAADRESTDWVMGGDGYLCRNEAVVSFGLGDASRVEQVTIDWPSGLTQTFSDVAVDQRMMIVEGQDLPHSLSRPGQHAATVAVGHSGSEFGSRQPSPCLRARPSRKREGVGIEVATITKR